MSIKENIFFEINIINILYLYNKVKKILLNNKEIKIRNILIVNDNWPYYWEKFINMIIIFYAHILKIKVYVLYHSNENYKCKRQKFFNSRMFLNKILKYDLDIEFIYNFDLTKLKWIEIEQIIFNLAQPNHEKK